MTDPSDPSLDPIQPADSEIEPAELARMQQLLRGALDEEPDKSPDVLRGVQRKLRDRSGGKFYTDGWSTARYAPVSTYLITSLLMVSFVIFVYLLIHPLSGAPEMVRSVPVPIQVIAPRR